MFIDENYKNQIFYISSIIEEIKGLVTSVKADTTSIKDSVEILVADKERKNLASHKAK